LHFSQGDEAIYVSFENGPLRPRTERLIYVRVYAPRCHVTDEIRGGTAKSIDKQAGEYTGSIFFGCILTCPHLCVHIQS